MGCTNMLYLCTVHEGQLWSQISRDRGVLGGTNVSDRTAKHPAEIKTVSAISKGIMQRLVQSYLV